MVESLRKSMRIFSLLFKLGICLLPWPYKRFFLQVFFGYQLHPDSYISLAWVYPKKLILQKGASIGLLTVCKGVEEILLEEYATIGRLNWITGLPLSEKKHFSHQPERLPSLILKKYASITHRHLIDCTNRVEIGELTTFAGFRSQILTHSIDIKTNRQSSAPVYIGEKCFIGSGCILLPGSALPNASILGAMSLLNAKHEEMHSLYGGVPAKKIKSLDPQSLYFHRTQGFVE